VVKSDKATAQRLLRQAKDTCAPDTDNALAAEAELGRLAGVEPAGENSLRPEGLGGAILADDLDSLTKILRQGDLDPFDRMVAHEARSKLFRRLRQYEKAIADADTAAALSP
jgi:hypothetical protein